MRREGSNVRKEGWKVYRQGSEVRTDGIAMDWRVDT
jgi:hypothetical protein